jgi:hypothetical protein
MTKPFKYEANTLYLIYDGDCYLCHHTAQSLRFNHSVKHWLLLNARESHPLVNQILAKGVDLNEGLLVIYKHQMVSGKEALALLSLLTSPVNVINRCTSMLFKSKPLSFLAYPLLKLTRLFLLKIRGKKLINVKPTPTLYDHIFRDPYEEIHPLHQRRYGIHYGGQEEIAMQGKLDIIFSKNYKLLLPFFKLTGALLDRQGAAITTKVNLKSKRQSSRITMKRVFCFPDGINKQFTSQILHLKSNQFVEITHNLFAWKFYFRHHKNKLSMHHLGFGLMLGNWYIPLPFIPLLIGKPYGEETPIDNHNFSMKVVVSHWLAKKLFSYQGTFRIHG